MNTSEVYDFQNGEEEKVFVPLVKVFGVGGAGGNAVNNMINRGLMGVDFIVANTDAQSLQLSLCDKRIQLGKITTSGLGAGASPEVGRKAAEESLEEIKDNLRGCHLVFITAGMGGGTGTGGAATVAKAAKELGILTVAVVTRPFDFEGSERGRMALEGIKELEQSVDTIIVVANQKLFRIANERTSFTDAFRAADDVLYGGVKCVTDLLMMPGLMNLDFADMRAIMLNGGRAMMGSGEATGPKRAQEATESAITNPLLDDGSLENASGLLINITGSTDVTLFEVDDIVDGIRSRINSKTMLKFGCVLDEEMDGTLKVSIVATGVGAKAKERAPHSFGAVENVEPKRIETNTEFKRRHVEDDYESRESVTFERKDRRQADHRDLHSHHKAEVKSEVDIFNDFNDQDTEDAREEESPREQKISLIKRAQSIKSHELKPAPKVETNMWEGISNSSEDEDEFGDSDSNFDDDSIAAQEYDEQDNMMNSEFDADSEDSELAEYDESIDGDFDMSDSESHKKPIDIDPVSEINEEDEDEISSNAQGSVNHHAKPKKKADFVEEFVEDFGNEEDMEDDMISSGSFDAGKNAAVRRPSRYGVVEDESSSQGSHGGHGSNGGSGGHAQGRHSESNRHGSSHGRYEEAEEYGEEYDENEYKKSHNDRDDEDGHGGSSRGGNFSGGAGGQHHGHGHSSSGDSYAATKKRESHDSYGSNDEDDNESESAKFRANLAHEKEMKRREYELEYNKKTTSEHSGLKQSELDKLSDEELEAVIDRASEESEFEVGLGGNSDFEEDLEVESVGFFGKMMNAFRAKKQEEETKKKQ